MDVFGIFDRYLNVLVFLEFWKIFGKGLNLCISGNNMTCRGRKTFTCMWGIECLHGLSIKD